jgi:uncharacterized protein (DUF58 family)
MDPKELLKSVRRIEIRTSHLVNDALAGQYHSAFRGRGMEFEEVRPYALGDDVRMIDWNVSARYGEPFVKVFREERELTVLLVVDVSASQEFGTVRRFKRELVAELGATLAFSAIKNNDKIGLLLFTDRVEKLVPPRKGTGHVLRVIRELLAYEPQGRGTDVAAALDHVNRVVRRRSVVFVVSDFQAAGYERALRIAKRRHDVILIDVADPAERGLPSVGLVELVDNETGRRIVVDTANRRWRRRHAEAMERAVEARAALLRQMKIDVIELRTGAPIVEPLVRFFRRRETRR